MKTKFLNTLAVILLEKSELVEGNFFPALEMQFGRLKHSTQLLFWMVLTADL